jgi:hypothetical protein
VLNLAVLGVQTAPEILSQDNEFKIKTLEKMPVFGIFVPL